MPVVTSARTGRRCAKEVANAPGKDRDTEEDQAAASRPTHQSGLRKGEWQRHHAIQDEPQNQAGEIEEWWPRYDACSCGITTLLAGTVHVRFSYLPGDASTARIGVERQLRCHSEH